VVRNKLWFFIDPQLYTNTTEIIPLIGPSDTELQQEKMFFLVQGNVKYLFHTAWIFFLFFIPFVILTPKLPGFVGRKEGACR
jgi:hypothetical protein